MFDIARRLEEAALSDDYFLSRHLYPNVDFYSGLILKAAGIPYDMFTVLFAIGRTPCWLAHWREMRHDGNNRIARPRQIYVGPGLRSYVPVDKREKHSVGVIRRSITRIIPDLEKYLSSPYPDRETPESL